MPAKVLEEVLDVLINNRGKTLSSISIKEISVLVLDVVVTDSGILAGSPDLVKQSVAAVLDKIGNALGDQGTQPSLQFEQLAMTALNSVLVAAAANPSLLKVNAAYAKVVGKLAGVLANALKDGRLNDREVEQILLNAAEIIAANVQLLAKEQDELVAKVIDAVLSKISGGDGISLRGDALVELLLGAIKVIAANGKLMQKVDETVEQLAQKIQVVISTGLEKAQQKLGQLLGQADIPRIIVELLRRYAFGQVPTLNIDDAQFNHVFDEIVTDIVGQIA